MNPAGGFNQARICLNRPMTITITNRIQPIKMARTTSTCHHTSPSQELPLTPDIQVVPHIPSLTPTRPIRMSSVSRPTSHRRQAVRRLNLGIHTQDIPPRLAVVDHPIMIPGLAKLSPTPGRRRRRIIRLDTAPDNRNVGRTPTIATMAIQDAAVEFLLWGIMIRATLRK